MSALACLLLTHDCPGHVARLVRALDCEGVTFFIHVDRKTDAAPFIAAVPPGERVVYLDVDRRVDVYWGGYSIVAATLNLLKVARKSSRSFTRYLLLSGSDFPIKHSEQILAALRDPAIEYLRLDRRIDPSQDDLFARRVKYLHAYDHPRFNPRSAPARESHNAAEEGLRAIPRGRYPGLPFYQGSAWWALTHDCVSFILAYLSDHPEYEAFHRFTSTSDEIFFHSIVAASPFRNRLSHDYVTEKPRSDAANDHASHFIDWLTPGVELPKVLDMSDWSRLQRSRALFARKFREPVSTELIQRLEELFDVASAAR